VGAGIAPPFYDSTVGRVCQSALPEIWCGNSDAKVPFTIKVLDSDEVNAFALPGGLHVREHRAGVEGRE